MLKSPDKLLSTRQYVRTLTQSLIAVGSPSTWPVSALNFTPSLPGYYSCEQLVLASAQGTAHVQMPSFQALFSSPPLHTSICSFRSANPLTLQTR